MKETEFYSLYSLKLKNNRSEIDYNSNKFENIKLVNKVFTIISIIISISHTIYYAVNWDNNLNEPWYISVSVLSFIISGIYIVIFPLLFVKITYIQKSINYTNYVFIAFLMYKLCMTMDSAMLMVRRARP